MLLSELPKTGNLSPIHSGSPEASKMGTTIPRFSGPVLVAAAFDANFWKTFVRVIASIGSGRHGSSSRRWG